VKERKFKILTSFTSPSRIDFPNESATKSNFAKVPLVINLFAVPVAVVMFFYH
jgi:hypothetical protein